MELSIGVGTRADVNKFEFCFGAGLEEIDYVKFLRLNEDEINQRLVLQRRDKNEIRLHNFKSFMRCVVCNDAYL